ncbi:MAG: DUF488 family protein [Deltaproteobacteria bacterium]|nr:DUF488 family protein [Deltaproteobacteria bacterium]
MVQTKSVYEPRAAGDGQRLLVMRYWPRGVRKDHVDAWQRELAPSVALIKAYKAAALPWGDFARRYRTEMKAQAAAIAELRQAARRRTITLLCGCAQETRCHRELLRKLVTAARA